MPTKFIQCKWLCDHCFLLMDTEPECHVHEREMHKQPANIVDALEELCERIQNEDRVDMLPEYERLCQMLANVARMKANNLVRPEFVMRLKETSDEYKSEVDCVDAADEEEEQFMNGGDNIRTLSDYEKSSEVKRAPIRRRSTHQSTHTFVCAVDGCAKQFSMKSELRQHNREEHKDINIAPKYDCDVCQKTFARERHLIMHRRMYTRP